MLTGEGGEEGNKTGGGERLITQPTIIRNPRSRERVPHLIAGRTTMAVVGGRKRTKLRKAKKTRSKEWGLLSEKLVKGAKEAEGSTAKIFVGKRKGQYRYRRKEKAGKRIHARFFLATTPFPQESAQNAFWLRKRPTRKRPLSSSVGKKKGEFETLPKKTRAKLNLWDGGERPGIPRLGTEASAFPLGKGGCTREKNGNGKV